MYKSKILSRMQAVTILLLVMDLFAAQASCPNCSPYTIVHSRDSTSGRIKLECRNSSTLERLDIHGVKFWVNRTSADDRDLRNRSDFSVIEDHNNNVIRFTLTGDLEGRFTCGIKIDVANIRESPPLALISLQTDRPKVPCQTTFAATSGDSVIIDCPVKVGVFKKYYSVTWYKDEESILEFDAPAMLTATEARYSIDRSSFALIIHSVDISYSNSSYRCVVFFTNPLSSTSNLIFSDVLLKLYVSGKPSIDPPTAIVSSDAEQPLFTCAVDYPAVPHLPTPEITWMYVNNKGVELTLTEDYHYTVSTNVARNRDVDGSMTLYSNFTLLRPCLAENESAVITCKAGFPGTNPSSSDAYLFKIATDSKTECRQQSSSSATALESVMDANRTTNHDFEMIALVINMLILSVIVLVIVVALLVVTAVCMIRCYRRKEYHAKETV